jgi:hypothetical protein
MKSKSDKNKTQNPWFGFHVSNAGNEIGHTEHVGWESVEVGRKRKGRGTGRKVDLQAGFVIAIPTHPVLQTVHCPHHFCSREEETGTRG